jgi:hypothetical protein
MATITGIIRTEDGSSALDAVVRAFDIDLRSEQLLGEAIIEETSGRYVISYTPEQVSRTAPTATGATGRAGANQRLRALH